MQTDPNPSITPQSSEFNSASHVLNLERKTNDSHGAEHTPCVILPPGHTALTWPMAIKVAHVEATVRVNSRTAFNDYLDRYAAPATLAVYADVQALTITGILDHHNNRVSGPAVHRLILQARLTPIMERWKPCLNKWLDQEAFIGFVDAEASFFNDGAKLLSLVSNFTTNERMEFTSVRRQTDGTFKVVYATETIKNGEEPLPETVTAFIPIYEGGPLVTLTFKLRYRVAGGKLSFHLWIPELADILRREFDTLVGQIAEDIHEKHDAKDVQSLWGSVMVIEGTPEFKPLRMVDAVRHAGMEAPDVVLD